MGAQQFQQHVERALAEVALPPRERDANPSQEWQALSEVVRKVAADHFSTKPPEQLRTDTGDNRQKLLQYRRSFMGRVLWLGSPRRTKHITIGPLSCCAHSNFQHVLKHWLTMAKLGTIDRRLRKARRRREALEQEQL